MALIWAALKWKRSIFRAKVKKNYVRCPSTPMTPLLTLHRNLAAIWKISLSLFHSGIFGEENGNMGGIPPGFKELKIICPHRLLSWTFSQRLQTCGDSIRLLFSFGWCWSLMTWSGVWHHFEPLPFGDGERPTLWALQIIVPVWTELLSYISLEPCQGSLDIQNHDRSRTQSRSSSLIHSAAFVSERRGGFKTVVYKNHSNFFCVLWLFH